MIILSEGHYSNVTCKNVTFWEKLFYYDKFHENCKCNKLSYMLKHFESVTI